MTIGERIRNRRIELDMSQEELALKVGYTSRSTINKIENNQNNLRQSKIKQIAEALNTTPSFIMGWDDEEDQKISGDAVALALVAKDKELLDYVVKLSRLSNEDRKYIYKTIDMALNQK